MISTIDERLVRLLGGAELSDLRARLRRRYELGPADGQLPSIQVGKLNETERTALASLVGRRGGVAASISIDVSAVDRALSDAGIAPSLRTALELLDGPIIHRETELNRIRESWAAVLAGCSHTDLIAYLASPLNFGVLKRLSGNQPDSASLICRQTEDILRRLPAAGVPRAQIAAEHLGDAHGLDSARPVATLTLAVLRSRSSTDTGDDRDTWAAVGILVNELAKPALFLNVPCSGLPVSPGEPQYASLRLLARRPSEWTVARRSILVCENPNLVAILADQLGTACPPVVCVDGHLGAAQRTILKQLKESGADLRYHGDYDWPGIMIANYVIAKYGAVPWHFSAADYVAASKSVPQLAIPLSGRPVIASWDADLTAAMIKTGIKIEEEAIAERIIDLLGKESLHA
ncbi:TIGR02679 family protein [Bradyrhizobium macuxiense]|uniref:TIGR02679 family protein n=1 Tax=Bradyrhizobium macuxiense TaxID=1755647 RepID=UPI0008334AAD|nr:TIGR02679 family protein [Bradyrhizobium macuxiense]